MTDAREVMRRYFSGSDYSCDDLISFLHGHGFRILGPDEIDGPTVEKCAEVAGRAGRFPVGSSDGGTYAIGTATDAATAIRALKEKRT